LSHVGKKSFEVSASSAGTLPGQDARLSGNISA
jgi:hypothetical protein